MAFRTAFATRLVLVGSLTGSLASAQVPSEPHPPPAVEVKAEDEVAACVKAAEEAQSQRSAHKLLAARTRFLACAQATCPAVVRNDCAVWLSDVERLIPTVVVSAKDPSGAELIDVRVLVDGELLTNRLDGLAQPVDPGIRLFRFEREGVAPVEREVVIREGERGRRLSIVLASPAPPVRHEAPAPAPPPARYPPIATYVFGGIGAVALGSFAYFGIKGRSGASDLADGCGQNKTCTEEQVSPVRTQLLVADISLGIGVVALGAAVYTLLTNAPPKKRPQGVQAELLVAPGVGRASLSTTF